MEHRAAHPALTYLFRPDGGSYQFLIGRPGTSKSFTANVDAVIPALRAGIRVTVLDACSGFRTAAEHFGVRVTPSSIGLEPQWETAPLAVLELEALRHSEGFIREGWERAARHLELRMQHGGLLVVDEVHFVQRVTRDSTHPLGPLLKRFHAQGNVKLLILGQQRQDLGGLISLFPPKQGDALVEMTRS